MRKTFYKFGYVARLGLKYKTLTREYKFMKKNLFKSIESNQSTQKDLLFKVIDFAIKNVPYYREIAKKRNIIPTKNKIFEDIKQFPILTKELIRKNWNSLHPDLKNLKYKIETSGGTTGEPIKVLQDWNFRLKNEAGSRILDEIGGYSIGDKLIRLWGNEKEILESTSGIVNKIINKYVKNTCFQNSFKMSEDIIKEYVKQINKIKPKAIIAYVQSLFEMARVIEKENLEIYPVELVITSAGILTIEMKEYLEKIFNCNVYNRYGSREVGAVATSCNKGNSLHINIYQQFIEILNEDNESLKEHQNGNIIITNLINYIMPLIRYKIGDLGSLNYERCPCGRGLIRLNNVVGRVVDIFKTENGEIIDGEYFTHLFYFRENVKKFQVVQEAINEVVISLVTNNNQKLPLEDEADLEEKIKLVMGQNCKVNFKYLSEIEPSNSGKFRYTISNF